jgi:hypothetical protein
LRRAASQGGSTGLQAGEIEHDLNGALAPALFTSPTPTTSQPTVLAVTASADRLAYLHIIEAHALHEAVPITGRLPSLTDLGKFV